MGDKVLFISENSETLTFSSVPRLVYIGIFVVVHFNKFFSFLISFHDFKLILDFEFSFSFSSLSLCLRTIK